MDGVLRNTSGFNTETSAPVSPKKSRCSSQLRKMENSAASKLIYMADLRQVMNEMIHYVRDQGALEEHMSGVREVNKILIHKAHKEEKERRRLKSGSAYHSS